MDIIIFIGFTFALAVIGLIFGKINEKRHYRSIEKREEQYRHILLFNEKVPSPAVSGQPFYLVSGSVVMSGDFFKQMVAGLIKIFGGRLTSYESMLDRGRREAVLRMKQKAAENGATMIFNVSFQTTMLGQNGGKSKLTCAEILVYGTAWKATF